MSKKKNFRDACLLGIFYTVQRQEFLIEEIMTQVNDLAAKLEQVNAQLAKAQSEIVAQVAALQTALENVALPADAETALAALATTAQALDDLNPDSEPQPEPVPEEPIV
ncbi:MAG: hypothetical protein ABL869_12085 [Candidatus Nitrotoga sp.]